MERLKIEGEQNTMQLNQIIKEKDIQVAGLLQKFPNAGNLPNVKNESNDLKDLENKEGGLVDVKKQIALAAAIIKVRVIIHANTFHESAFIFY